MIRACEESDFEALLALINAAAEAYRGIIPPDRWKEPYMPAEELAEEIAAGVQFQVFEEAAVLKGVTAAPGAASGRVGGQVLRVRAHATSQATSQPKMNRPHHAQQSARAVDDSVAGGLAVACPAPVRTRG